MVNEFQCVQVQVQLKKEFHDEIKEANSKMRIKFPVASVPFFVLLWFWLLKLLLPDKFSEVTRQLHDVDIGLKHVWELSTYDNIVWTWHAVMDPWIDPENAVAY